jgi:hypothetical protein
LVVLDLGLDCGGEPNIAWYYEWTTPAIEGFTSESEESFDWVDDWEGTMGG